MANTVSVGTAGNERRLTNVAPGIAATDAATISQLSGAQSQFNSQITNLQSQVNDNQTEARSGTALALALGATITTLQPGRKFALSVGVGNFEGNNAVGIGGTALLYDTKSYMVTMNAGVGFGLNTNTVGTRGGVSLQW